MKKEPLANRMRPTNLDEIVGQESIIGKGTVLRKRIEKDNLLNRKNNNCRSNCENNKI